MKITCFVHIKKIILRFNKIGSYFLFKNWIEGTSRKWPIHLEKKTNIIFPIIPGEGRLFLVWASTGWLRSWEIDDDEYFDKHVDDDDDEYEYENDEFAAKDCFSTWMKPPGIRAPRGTSPGTRRGSGFWKRFWSWGWLWWSWWLWWKRRRGKKRLATMTWCHGGHF